MTIKSNINLKVALATSILFTLASCQKNDDPEPQPQQVSQGVFVLNEGGWGKNNASLSYYGFNSQAVTADIFASTNPQIQGGLGDLAQDMHVYGSKMYIVVGGSNTVEVVSPSTAKSIKSIELPNISPKYLASANGKVFISAQDDKVHVLDTVTLTITKAIAVGQDPAHMAVVGNKLYVANSGEYEHPTYDNTISVIDLTTLTEISKITVAINLHQMEADKYGDLYVVSRGRSYGDQQPLVPSALYVVNPTTGTIKKKFDFEATDLAIHEDIAYVYSYSYITFAPSYKVINVKDETVVKETFISDGTSIGVPYAIGVDPVLGDVYISDAKDYVNSGAVYCFDSTGKKKFSFTAGVLPNKFSFFVTQQ